MKKIFLNKNKDKAAWQLHPWVFSGAMQQVKELPENGEVVAVHNVDQEFIAYGIFHGNSRVAVRLLEWHPDRVIDDSWWRQKLSNAVAARFNIRNENTNTYRLVFAEADFIPGLIVDQYADFLVLQVHSAGLERIKPLLIDELVRLVSPKGIYERSDLKSREYEGLPNHNGLLFGDHPPEFLQIIENGIKYEVNIAEGQKSGFYCDQRENRYLTAQYVEDKRVLDCFSYSGGFALNAFAQGAKEVWAVDSSPLAIETLIKNVALNKFDSSKLKTVQSDVNKYLRTLHESKEKFDVIILDPPKYAPSRSALEKASRAYKDLNRRAMMLMDKGGLLATFSCSGAMDIDTFKQVIAWAALDAGKEIQFIRQFSQPEDHPVRASFPEGEYLKGLLVRIC